MKRKDKSKFIASEITFLDPLNCDSTIGYHLRYNYRGHLRAVMDLSDCNRKINWYFESDDKNQNLAKVDKAISILQNFRKQLALAKKTRR